MQARPFQGQSRRGVARHRSQPTSPAQTARVGASTLVQALVSATAAHTTATVEAQLITAELDAISYTGHAVVNRRQDQRKSHHTEQPQRRKKEERRRQKQQKRE